MNDRTPRPLKVRETPAGHVLSVQMPPSMSTLPLADASEVIAAGMSVREVRVVRDSSRADRATVSIIRRDPLGDGSVLSWPHISADRLSIWDDIPVGLDEMGEVVYINLVESNELIAGEPGAGKSVKQSILVATAALDPGCDLYLFDGNRVEFSPWRSCAVSFVGPSVEETTEALRDLVSEMNRRYEVLERTGKRKIERGDGLRPIVIVINELAHYLSSEDPKSDKVVAGLLRRLVAQGRAAGVITVVATQKPSADVIPTYLRDLFAYRCALRCTTPQASDTVLGQGWASAGFSASDIDSSCRGVGYLLSEGSEPRRMKAFYLSDSEIGALAIRGSAIREVEREVRRIDPAA